ncbi:hypothetical protein GCM10023206_01380 [Acinetobacter puyangensis]|uniref:Ribosomal protein S18 acetylase RimI n=1 Tax=Acinetobacter puyangensis TaxID=1096779 RepID=A0A240E7B3_9GAMM|nr:GNAT family N-acetyltransferase [Acinetobacter puyangensis]SNX44512.1 Ribosomal protein S18 acetylase RimI [Acinetobacter puyangensis]
MYELNGIRISRKDGKQIHIRSFQNKDLPAVFQLLQSHGWSHRIVSQVFLEQLIANSQLVYVVECQSQIIGFARAITDFLSNGYLSMLVVDRTFQRQGIASQLIKTLMAQAPAVTWVLRAGREGAGDFFQSQGFKFSEIAMERSRPE